MQAQTTYHVDAGPCRGIHWKKGPHEIKRLIRCLAERYPVPGGAEKAIDVGRCESGLDPRAVSGKFKGLYQHGTPWWPERWRKYAAPLGLPSNIMNGRSNATVSLRIAHRQGWGIWTCGT